MTGEDAGTTPLRPLTTVTARTTAQALGKTVPELGVSAGLTVGTHGVCGLGA